MTLLSLVGLKEEKLYEEAMANDLQVSLSYTKILALGPGQVGKSSFLYRLMGLMKWNIQESDPKTLPQSSTGIAEMREACITYSSRTGALTSDSWQVFDEGSDLQCQLNGLMYLLIEQSTNKRPEQFDTGFSQPTQTKEEVTLGENNNTARRGEQAQPQYELNESHNKDVEAKPQTTDTTTNTSVSISVSDTSYPHPQHPNIDKVIADFNKLKDECRFTPSKTKFRVLFNIADVGGQPAFLEMLPSLTIGPALYLVFMKLLDGLTTRYPVAFKCKEGRGSKLCEKYTYTSEEVIFTALSSIACFGNSDEEVEKYVTKFNTGDNKQTNSLAVLVGTFRDEIKDDKKLAEVDSQLKKQLEETDFCDGLIHSKSFLRVNNDSAPELEIKQQRELLEKLLKEKFQRYKIPTRWLILSICLKLLARRENQHHISFDDCVELGRRLGMKREMVKVALQFLHKYIGLVMYFPKNAHLKNVVICDPQVVFSSISELIFGIYDPTELCITETQHDIFVRTGCFCPQEITTTLEKKQTLKKLLSVETLVHLLVHLNIITEVPLSMISIECESPKKLSNRVEEVKDTSTTKKLYFLPAVLQTAKLSPVTRGASDEQLPEPLCIRFQTGYLPLGFVCALCANFIAESNLELIPFEEDGQQITYKNKIRFRFQGMFDIIMISHSKYCEFHVSRCSDETVDLEYWDRKCCPRIREIICEAANRVIQSMKQGSLYKLSKGYDLAFKCPHHGIADFGHEPLAKIEDSLSSLGKEIVCVISLCKKRSSLSPEMNMWFGEVRAT